MAIRSIDFNNISVNRRNICKRQNISFGKSLLNTNNVFSSFPSYSELCDTFTKSSAQTKNTSMPDSYQAFGSSVKLKKPKYIVDGDYRYMLIEPENVDKNKQLPLVVYLSGTGEYKLGELGTVGRVDKNNDGLFSDDEVKHNALGTIISGWKLKDFNGYVIAPSLEKVDVKGWVNPVAEKYVRGIVDSFTQTHKVNPNMTFVGGHSIGGMGSLYMAKHASDIFSKAFTLSGFSHESYDLKDISIPIIGYNGQNDSEFMSNDFATTFGKENFVRVATKHGSVPVNAFNRDANSDGKSDLIQWLFEGQKLPENSDEY